METKTEEQIKTEEFVKSTGIEIIKQYAGHRPYFQDDKHQRAVFQVTIKRGNKSISFTFGDSIANSYAVAGDHFKVGEFRKICRIPKHKNIPYKDIMYLIHNYKDLDKCLAVGGGAIGGRDNIQLVKVTNSLPSDYAILSCLEKYEVGTFYEWCNNFGYDTDSRKAEKIYFDCQRQFSDVSGFFTPDELIELQDIN